MKRLVSLYEGHLSDKILIEKESVWHDIRFCFRHDRWYCDLPDDLALLNGQRSFILDDGLYKMVKEGCFFTICLVVQKPPSFRAFARSDFLLSDIEKADIVYDKVSNYHIFLKGDRLHADTDLIYCNGKKYRGQRLENHDVIDYLGVRIIVTDTVLLVSDSCKHIGLSPFTIRYLPYTETYKMITKKYHHHPTVPPFAYKVKLKTVTAYQEAPFLVSFGQGVFMSVGMLVIAVVNAYLGYQNGRSMIETALIVALPLMMAFGAILFPFIQRKHRQKINHQKSTDQINMNTEVLNDLRRKIETDIASLKEYYDYYRFDSEKYLRLLDTDDIFQRDRDDDDLLYLTLGIGKIALDLKIDADHDEDKIFFKDIMDSYKEVNGTYILDLKQKRYITFIAEGKKRDTLFMYILLQLTLQTSANDLKIAICADRAFIKEHPELYAVRHLWLFDRRLLFDHELKDLTSDHKLVIMSFYKGDEICKDNISYLYFGNDPLVPKKSDLVIEYHGDELFVKDGDRSEIYRSLVFAYDPRIFYRLCRYRETDEEMVRTLVKLDDIYPLDIDLNKTYEASERGIEITLGIDQNGQLLHYDISQKGIGPHGLIGGATGSGKTELVLALIMSLVLNKNAHDLNIALIDFKGTGLREALSYNGELLPHVDLALSNLDEVAFDRSLAYFRLECKRREEAFQKLAAMTHTSIMDLEDYNRADPLSHGLAKIPHLVIVIDEFAELKASRQDFMQDIISIARIGRSLGIMMILVTQKPAAVVDKEVWANTSYKIALKVNDVADSKELINSDLAYKIRKPGEFYLISDKLSHGQCVYTRSLVDERNHEAVEIIDLEGRVIKAKEFTVKNEERQLSYFIKKIIEYHKEKGIRRTSIYKEALSEESFTTLFRRYGLKPDEGVILLGEDDDFSLMIQRPTTHDLKADPFVIFSYKTSECKEAFYSLVLTSLALHADRCHFIMIADKHIDLNVYDGLVEKVGCDDIDDIRYIFHKIKKGSERRVVIFIDDYMRFIQSEERRMILEKAIFHLNDKKTAIIIATNTKISLPFRLDQVFRKYVLEYENKEELVYAFNKAQAVSERNVYMRHERLIGFKLCRVPKIDINLKRTVDFIDRLPDKIKAENGLLGYDIFYRNKIYTPEGKILFVAYYKEILERFKRVYKASVDHAYHVLHDVPKDIYYDAICWIGPNMTNQYLFIPKVKRDLKAEEAYIEIGKEVHIIRYVDA